MRIPKVLTIAAALAALILVAAAGYLLLRPPGDLLQNARFGSDLISPNADGMQDITTIQYELSRNARVSIYLENADGERYYFRQDEPRIPGEYSVLFSGIVDGFVLPGEEIPGTVERRLIPNGEYEWTIEASADSDQSSASGSLTITDADSELPTMPLFEITPPRFTPNQDGINDRVTVNVFLEKEAALSVYLEDASGQRYYLPERELTRPPGAEGNHEFDWDAGVDQNMRPPDDGTYRVVAVAQDDEGQRTWRESTVTIENGGLPQVELVAQTTGTSVYFTGLPYDDRYYTDSGTNGEKIAKPEGVMSEQATLNLQQGDLLVFKVTVYNYGTTPVRTGGPFPGTVYQFDQTFATLGEFEEAGAWRVGIKCDTSMSDFPWRWAIAPKDQLEVVYNEEDDATYYYLPAGARAEVWGAIRMTDIEQANNPQDCWAGLIHEQVRTAQERFGAREIRLTPVDEN